MSRRADLLEAYKLARQLGDDEKALKYGEELERMDAEKQKPVAPSPIVTPEQNLDGFSTWQMIKNIPSSAAQYGKDIYNSVVNIDETVPGLLNLANSAGQKIDSLLVPHLPDWFVENTNRSQNWLADRGLPVNRNAVEGDQMTYDNLAPAEAMGRVFADRYGSGDAALKTLESDPVGVLGDVSGLLTLGGGTGIRGLGVAGRAVDPLNLTKNIIKEPMRRISPKWPEEMYQSAVKFSTTIDEAERGKLARTALDEGILPSEKGLQKARAIITGLNDELTGLINEADAAGKLVPVNAVFRALRGLRKEVGGAKLEAPTKLKHIDNLAKEFHEHMKSRGQTHMTISEVQEFKKSIYKDVFGDKVAVRTIPEKDRARLGMAQGAKEIVENELPAGRAREINAREGGLLALEKALDRPVSRINNNNLIGMDAPVKTGLGYMLGEAVGSPELGTGLGYFSSLMGQPAIKTRNAMLIDRLRKAGGQGLLTQDPAIRTLLQQIGFQSGRAQREGLLQ
jgi:hypothetical protein